jgi:hypothetical protein
VLAGSLLERLGLDGPRAFQAAAAVVVFDARGGRLAQTAALSRRSR